MKAWLARKGAALAVVALLLLWLLIWSPLIAWRMARRALKGNPSA